MKLNLKEKKKEDVMIKGKLKKKKIKKKVENKT